MIEVGMNLRLMALNIREFCPVLSLPVIKQRINVRYKQILNMTDWEFLKDSAVVRLYPVYSPASTVATVAINQGGVTITGTGTTMDSAHVGYYFRFNSEAQPYIIRNVENATSFSVENAYAGTTQTVATYDLFKTIYSPVVGDVGRIMSVVYENSLPEKSLTYLNSIDPERTSTGQPECWCNRTKSTSVDGIASIEIWPVPDSPYALTINYIKTVSDLSADTDAPLFRPEVLEAGALWDCYRLAFAVTQNPAYIGLARDAKTDFEGEIRRMTIEDLRTSSLPTSVRDSSTGMGFNDNYQTSHDTESW